MEKKLYLDNLRKHVRKYVLAILTTYMETRLNKIIQKRLLFPRIRVFVIDVLFSGKCFQPSFKSVN